MPRWQKKKGLSYSTLLLIKKSLENVCVFLCILLQCGCYSVQVATVYGCYRDVIQLLQSVAVGLVDWLHKRLAHSPLIDFYKNIYNTCFKSRIKPPRMSVNHDHETFDSVEKEKRTNADILH